MSRIRLKYTKGQAVKFISHLDLLRTFHRAIKRANIPIVYSQGFNPHQSVSFGPPLPLGTTSEAEFLEIELAQDVEPETIKKALNDSLPTGVEILHAELVVDKNEKFLSSFVSANYNVRIEFKDVIENSFNDKIKEFLSSQEILIEKKGKKGTKTVDILPDILELEVLRIDNNIVEFFMRLSCGSIRNLKPELLIEAMEKYINGFEVDYYRIHRVYLSSI